MFERTEKFFDEKPAKRKRPLEVSVSAPDNDDDNDEALLVALFVEDRQKEVELRRQHALAQYDLARQIFRRLVAQQQDLRRQIGSTPSLAARNVTAARVRRQNPMPRPTSGSRGRLRQRLKEGEANLNVLITGGIPSTGYTDNLE